MTPRRILTLTVLPVAAATAIAVALTLTAPAPRAAQPVGTIIACAVETVAHQPKSDCMKEN